jgi:hypothetical protein
VDCRADLSISTAGMSTGTTRNYLVIRFQRHRRRCADLLDQSGPEHCARLTAEHLVVLSQALAGRIGTEVRHDSGWEDNPIGQSDVSQLLQPSASRRGPAATGGGTGSAGSGQKIRDR